MEYESNRSGGKTEAMVLHLLDVIPSLKRKQAARIRRNVSRETGEVAQNQFIVTMDNYFTLPKVISKLRENGIGVVGTSRFQRNWPPKELKLIDGEKVQFNDFFWMVR